MIGLPHCAEQDDLTLFIDLNGELMPSSEKRGGPCG
jgi:hypothetical protein